MTKRVFNRSIPGLVLFVTLGFNFRCELFDDGSEPSGNNAAFGSELVDIDDLPPDVEIEQPGQDIPGSEDLVIDGVIGLNSVYVQQKATIDSNITVVGMCEGVLGPDGCLRFGNELAIGQKAVVGADFILKADSVKVEQKAAISGTVEGNELDISSSATVANLQSPLGDVQSLPSFLIGTPGENDVGADDSPLASGNYAALKLRDHESIVLEGGFYHFTEVDAGSKSSITCQGSCIVLVKGRFSVKAKSVVKADSGSNNDLIFFVEGDNGSNGNVWSLPAVATIGQKSEVLADFYVPNGTLSFRQNSEARGIFIAKWVCIGQESVITAGDPIVIEDPPSDEEPPTVISITAIDNTHVEIIYSEAMDKTSVEDVSNYSIVPPLGISIILQDTMALNRIIVSTSPQFAGLLHQISINNVTDLAGNPIDPIMAIFIGVP